MSRVIPLHTYQSPNGHGLCTYETDGMACGNAEAYVVHVRTGCGVEAKFRPVTDATLSPLVPGQGMRPKANPDPELGQEYDRRPKDPVSAYLKEKADMAHETYHGAVFPVDDPPTTAQVVALFHDAALRLAVAKDQTYRRAWVEQGYMGNVGRILSKASRLRALVWRDEDQMAEGGSAEGGSPEEHEESLRDTLLDMANLCAFAAHNMAQGNRWGGDRG